MSSKAPVTTTQQDSSSTSGPIKFAEPYVKTLYGKTNALVKHPYKGDYVAGPQEAQYGAATSLLDAAPGLDRGVENLRSMADRISSGEFLDPNNSILQGGIQGSLAPIQRSLMNEIMPGVTDQSIRAGAFGGTGDAFANTEVLNNFADTSSNLAGKMTLDWFNQRFPEIFQTPGLYDAANKFAVAPSQAMMQAGDYQQKLAQDILNNKLAKRAGKWTDLSNASNIYSQGGYKSGTGTSTTTETGPEPDVAAQWVQGIMGGLGTAASLATGFPGAMPAFMQSWMKPQQSWGYTPYGNQTSQYGG